MHVTWRTTTKDNTWCYLLSHLYIVHFSVYFRIELSLFDVIKENLDVNCVRYNATHLMAQNETTSKRWNKFLSLFGNIFIGNRCIPLHRISLHFDMIHRHAAPHNIYLVMPHAAHCYPLFTTFYLRIESLWLWFWIILIQM